MLRPCGRNLTVREGYLIRSALPNGRASDTNNMIWNA